MTLVHFLLSFCPLLFWSPSRSAVKKAPSSFDLFSLLINQLTCPACFVASTASSATAAAATAESIQSRPLFYIQEKSHVSFSYYIKTNKSLSTCSSWLFVSCHAFILLTTCWFCFSVCVYAKWSIVFLVWLVSITWLAIGFVV